MRGCWTPLVTFTSHELNEHCNLLIKNLIPVLRSENVRECQTLDAEKLAEMRVSGSGASQACCSRGGAGWVGVCQAAGLIQRVGESGEGSLPGLGGRAQAILRKLDGVDTPILFPGVGRYNDLGL